GHQMGLGESEALICPPGVRLSSSLDDCYDYPYGDPYDVMAGGDTRYNDFNARTKENFGWITVPQITASGRYTINPIGAAESAVKARKIAAGSGLGYYYLEYRRKLLGAIQPLSTLSTYDDLDGLLVHYVPAGARTSQGYNVQNAMLIPMHPS